MSAWIEAGVYIGAILLIVVIVVVSHINSKPCKILSVEELEDIWNA